MRYDLTSAIQSYTRALSLDPEFLEALVARGDVYMDMTDRDDGREKARADYNKVRSRLSL